MEPFYTKQITITSKKLYEDLKKYNLTQNKSVNGVWVDIKRIPNNLLHHFVRGYFDGDGCIYYNKNAGDYVITFTGSTLFIKELLKLLQIQCGVRKGNLSHRNIDSLYNATLSLGGNLQVARLGKWLYDQSTVFLERKYEKIKPIL